MSVLLIDDLQLLTKFSGHNNQLAVAEREPLDGADIFFQKLMQTDFRVVGQVFKGSGEQDIRDILEDVIPVELSSDPFYHHWIADMASVCDIFCDTIDSESVGFCIGTQRGCRRYHIDNVPMRLLVTYAGQGTEWLPDEAADRRALAKGAPNEEIVKDPSARQFMKAWDIAIFRGGPKGLLHRTPDTALNTPSILMRLDHASFWSSIMKQQQDNILPQPVNA